ncbi:MAG: hypothetical protein IM542_03735 [Pseudanabaena sp. M165S2SP1A06QC]|jgi:predicted amidophosphoribosyltransferase|uniref:hypothetical protein n=1 Tax=Pseudanabaena mucicola TaxID=71190 RepID=UPI000E9D3210|nr:hypothetical protein [Pseudanabaena mucicola]MCA6621697.1 hypothetical protein [Pseudanabaena sp. M165S2SP1A06QC]HBC42325.1 hypothetical protein [Pseudanabaena sp.]
MTDLLERTITKLRDLSVEQQDAIAMMILEELEDDSKWDRSFASSQNLLAKLAEEAMAEYRAGETEELSPKKS